jgi:predicted RNase H-like HicB family nuclease
MKLYPVVIHKDKKSAFGVTIPDLPGCFSAGATLDEALRNVQEAVEVHLHGEDIAPEPSGLDHWKANPDYRDAYAVALAPVDLAFMNDATVRVNITARKSELAIVDRAAKRAHMDRSAYLVVSAIERAKSAVDKAVTPVMREGAAGAKRVTRK